MYGCGVRRGDEIICPSLTYWASALPVFSLGGTVVFADIEPDSICIDPKDIEHRITPRTKAIVIVHYCGHPADMDPIMEIAAQARDQGDRGRVARARRALQGPAGRVHRGCGGDVDDVWEMTPSGRRGCCARTTR